MEREKQSQYYRRIVGFANSDTNREGELPKVVQFDIEKHFLWSLTPEIAHLESLLLGISASATKY